MPSDKQLLIERGARYPSTANVLLFCGTMAACVGVVLCVYSVTYTISHTGWLIGVVTFGAGVLLSIASMLYIVAAILRRRTVEAAWVQNSASPYEDDFSTDYFFTDNNYGFVYKPTTYAPASLMVSTKPAPKNPNAYRLVYGADQD